MRHQCYCMTLHTHHAFLHAAAMLFIIIHWGAIMLMLFDSVYESKGTIKKELLCGSVSYFFMKRTCAVTHIPCGHSYVPGVSLISSFYLWSQLLFNFHIIFSQCGNYLGSHSEESQKKWLYMCCVLVVCRATEVVSKSSTSKYGKTTRCFGNLLSSSRNSPAFQEICTFLCFLRIRWEDRLYSHICTVDMKLQQTDSQLSIKSSNSSPDSVLKKN